MTARDRILNKLRAARRPFPDAQPPPTDYLPAVRVDDTAPDALLQRFTAELEALEGEVFAVDSADAAREQVLSLLRAGAARRVMSWHFKHIPVPRLYTAIQQAGYTVDYPQTRGDDRPERLARLETAEIGLTGASVAIAGTGTLVIQTGKGMTRLPAILPPTHIAVIRLRQIIPRIEDWLAHQRRSDSPALNDPANVCFVTGPSRTADIEKMLVLGVHGPKRVQVIVIR